MDYKADLDVLKKANAFDHKSKRLSVLTDLRSSL